MINKKLKIELEKIFNEELMNELEEDNEIYAAS